MNVLFLGRFYPKQILKTISKDTFGKVGFSNHNFELSLINGLADQNDVTLRVITAPYVFSFPHNNRRFHIKPELYEYKGIKIRSIGFINFVGLNILSIIYNLTNAIIEEFNSFEGNEVSVIVNTPSLELSTALFNAIKKTSKQVTTVLIVPDVPECMLEMSGKKSLKKKVIQKINDHIATLSKKYNKYVLLTDAMNDFYHVEPKDYIIMEGIADDNLIREYNHKEPISDDREIILYTGSLRRIFGVMNLIEIFEKGDFPNTVLWICGSGECTNEIEERAKQNPNITFFGLVDTARARDLQSQATLLVNPRSSQGSYTKYSFPSKTIEYLLTGKTVIMNRLPGITKEYDSFLNYPESESVESWISKISEIMQEDILEREKKALQARKFIEEQKSSKYQCSRIINLCKN